jgi:5,10-methylene-tetrahydrofolate dehydrogenase/methenyl tetrahydrofolate cyclohydrolase
MIDEICISLSPNKQKMAIKWCNCKMEDKTLILSFTKFDPLNSEMYLINLKTKEKETITPNTTKYNFNFSESVAISVLKLCIQFNQDNSVEGCEIILPPSYIPHKYIRDAPQYIIDSIHETLSKQYPYCFTPPPPHQPMLK